MWRRARSSAAPVDARALRLGEGVAVELGPLGDGLGAEIGGDTEVALDAGGPRELGWSRANAVMYSSANANIGEVMAASLPRG